MSAPFDAVIVGSGAGGGAAAWKLTRAGLRVCVLEKGPHYTEQEFFHDEIAVCRRSFWTPDPLLDPHVLLREGKEPERSAFGQIACCVGGGTVHMGGYFFRLRPEDLRLKTRYGPVAGAALADWPITFEELEPHYDEAEELLGLSGPQDAPLPEGRTRPYPNGPLLSHPSAGLIEEACKKVGLHAFQTPRAVLSADYRKRQACQYCGFCGSYGCEVGAKSSVPVTFLAGAAHTGRLTLRPGHAVQRVTTAPDGSARGVLVVGPDGKQSEVRGRVVLLACSAIETARLLLCSGQQPQGLANGSGQVGRNLLFATFAGGLGRFRAGAEPFSPESDRLPFLDRSVQDFYFAEGQGLPFAKGGTLIFQRAHFNPIFLAERAAARPGEPPLFGAALQRRLREVFLETRTLEWEALGEFLPHPGCSVTLDPEIKDQHGRPAARVQLGVHPASLAACDFLAAKGRAVMEAAGALQQGPIDGERVYPFLQAGTARMGSDPSLSVVGPDCQAHEVKGLYVADSSSFPSAGGAPFTLTIMANALRVAAGVVARMKRRDG